VFCAGFDDGSPDGHDPLVLARQMAASGITLASFYFSQDHFQTKPFLVLRCLRTCIKRIFGQCLFLNFSVYQMNLSFIVVRDRFLSSDYHYYVRAHAPIADGRPIDTRHRWQRAGESGYGTTCARSWACSGTADSWKQRKCG